MEDEIAPVLDPVGEVVAALLEFVVDHVGRSDLTGIGLSFEPGPEGGYEVEAVVAVLRLDEDVRIEHSHDQATPIDSSSFGRLAGLTPNSRDASRIEVSDASTLSRTDSVRRLLFRIGAVR